MTVRTRIAFVAISLAVCLMAHLAACEMGVPEQASSVCLSILFCPILLLAIHDKV